MIDLRSLEFASRLNLQRLVVHFLIREPFRRVQENFGPGRLIQGVALNAAGEAARDCGVRLHIDGVWRGMRVRRCLSH
eukprot:6180451-Prymnesium_polylepis.1